MSIDAYHHHMQAGEPGSPLLFLIHGTGGDETQLLDLKDEIMPAASVVAPRGDVNENGAARFFRRTGEGVYDMDDLARATARMGDFVKAHIKGAEAPPRLVAALGYSNGANILANLVFAEPALFDAVVLMHPLIPFVPHIAAPLDAARILVTAGRNDPICPPETTERLEAYLRAAGADIVMEWHEGGHEVRPEEIAAAKRFFAAETASRRKGNPS